MNVALATYLKLAFLLAPCVFAMCLKSTKSNGVTTSAVKKLQITDVIRRLAFWTFG
jgi:hypothetical protein